MVSRPQAPILYHAQHAASVPLLRLAMPFPIVMPPFQLQEQSIPLTFKPQDVLMTSAQI